MTATPKAPTRWDWPPTCVTNIVDADTVDAMLTRDLGFGGEATFPVRLRLNRINAPKLATPAGKTARDRVLHLLAGVPVRITTVKHYKYSGPEDTVNEYMAELVFADGTNLSDVLVAEGHAVYWDGTGPRPDDDGTAA